MLEKGWDINVIMKDIFYYFFGVFAACATRAKKPKLSEIYWLG